MPNFQAIMNYISDICLYLTQNLIIKEMNPAAAEFYQITQQEAVSQSYLDICSNHNLPSLLPDSLDNLAAGNVLNYKLTTPLVKMDCTLISVKEADEEQEGYILIARSLQSNSKITDVHTYYENLIAHMPGNVYWLDRNCVTLGCNDNVVKLIGLKSREEFIGITYEEMGKLAGWTEGQAESFKKDDMKVMSSGIPVFNVEEPPLYDKDGNPVYYLSSRVPLKDGQGDVVGVVGISIDITEKKKAEKNLKKALRSKAEFLSLMTHEIRGPLSNVIGAVELIKFSLSKNEPINNIYDYLNIIGKEIDRTLNLLSNVIKILDLDDGKFQTNYDLIDVKDLVQRIRNDLIENKSAAISISTAAQVPNKILIDSIHLIEVLKILIGNALRFTSKGTIEISINTINLESKGNSLIITIKDNGCGIEPNQQRNIFKTFISPEEESEGTIYRKPGIKLSLAKKMIELMGGTLLLESQPNIGTTVTIYLPYKEGDGANQARKEQNEIVTKEYKDFCLNLLLVEDDYISAGLEKKSLENLGHKVTVAATGAQAIDLASKHKFDLIFMDITLPDIDGVNVTKQILRQGSFDIVAVTSHVTETDIKRFIENGMITAIPKPVSQQAFKEFLLDYQKILEERAMGGED